MNEIPMAEFLAPFSHFYITGWTTVTSVGKGFPSCSQGHNVFTLSFAVLVSLFHRIRDSSLREYFRTNILGSEMAGSILLPEPRAIFPWNSNSTDSLTKQCTLDFQTLTFVQVLSPLNHRPCSVFSVSRSILNWIVPIYKIMP